MADFWEIAAHSVDHMLSFVFLTICLILVIFHFGFVGWNLVLISSVHDLCILLSIVMTLVAVEYMYCRATADIHRLTLPPHSTLKMQPLDRTYFKPLKSAFNNVADTYSLYRDLSWASHPNISDAQTFFFIHCRINRRFSILTR